MTPDPNRRWHPLETIPMFASMIDSELHAAREHHDTLQRGQHRPYCLDNATVARIKEVYGVTAADSWLYDTQLAAWSDRHDLTATHRGEVERLETQMRALHEVVDSILALADRLASQTIEALMAKSDVEVGLEWLLGQHDR